MIRPRPEGRLEAPEPPGDPHAPGSRDETRELAGVVTGIRRAGRDADLAREGWTRRFVGGPPGLKDQVALYESLGHEVMLDPLRPEELATACSGCALALALFRVVYTRSRT